MSLSKELLYQAVKEKLCFIQRLLNSRFGFVDLGNEGGKLFLLFIWRDNNWKFFHLVHIDLTFINSANTNSADISSVGFSCENRNHKFRNYRTI